MDRPASASRRRRALAGLLALAAATAQADQTTLFDIGPSAVMVSSCAGLQNGNGFSPGGLVGMLPARSQCLSATTTDPVASVSRSAAYDELPTAIQAASHGTAQFGQLKLSSSFHADTINGLTIGVVNAGWNSTQTVLPANPADLGQLALYSFDLHVHGTLDGAGFGNSAVGISMWALVNEGFTGSLWSAQGMGVLGVPYHEDLDEIVTMSVPIQLGVPFQLSLFAATWSGNSSGFGGISDAHSDLLSTLTWGGVRSVSVNGNPVDYALTSTNGIDWRSAFAPAGVTLPEPATAWLLAAGALALGMRRRRSTAAA